MTCICSCNKCSKLFIIYHTITDQYFAVGSSCVRKFKPNGYNGINRPVCQLCMCPLWYKNTKKSIKNANKKNKDICFNCIHYF